MPVVTFTLLKDQPAALKTKLGRAVHLARENPGFSKADRFQRFLELDNENFSYDLYYPDLAEPRTDRFVLGRSVKNRQSESDIPVMLHREGQLIWNSWLTY